MKMAKQYVCTLDNSCIHKHTCGRDGLCSKAATFDKALSYAYVSVCLFCCVQWMLCKAIRFVIILLKAKLEVFIILRINECNLCSEHIWFFNIKLVDKAYYS